MHWVDASGRFLARLRGVTDPELKRKIIGEEFIRVFEAEARGLGDIKFLVQGTPYQDVMDSVFRERPSGHHREPPDVGGLPPDLKFKLMNHCGNSSRIKSTQ